MGSSKAAPYDNNPPGAFPHASSSTAAASSSHQLQPYTDTDIDADADLAPPPAYTEQDTTTPRQPKAPPQQQPQPHPPLPDITNYILPDSQTVTHSFPETYVSPSLSSSSPTPTPASKVTGALKPRTRHTTLVLSPTLTTDASALYSVLLTQSRLPPHLSINVVGTHEEKRGRGTTNSRKTEIVTDFRFKIDVGSSLLRGWDLDDVEGEKWRTLRVVKDEDDEKAYRGGRVKTRGGDAAAGSIRIPADTDGLDGFDNELTSDLEALIHNNASPSSSDSTSSETNLTALRTWCHRFTHDPSPIRTLTLHRPILNLDFPTIQSEITSLIRSLNYRGRINITPTSTHHALTIQTPHILNRARANAFVWWMCVILQLWVVTWPIIWLLEKRYEVVESRWYTSHVDQSSYDPSALSFTRTFARDKSEKECVAYWAKAIKEAALTRRRDWEVVGEGDVRRLATEGGDGVEVLRRAEMEADWERRVRVVRGEGTWRDAMVGFWRGWTGRGNEWDQVRGWGGDI